MVLCSDTALPQFSSAVQGLSKKLKLKVQSSIVQNLLSIQPVYVYADIERILHGGVEI